jgi:hypothetical protein
VSVLSFATTTAAQASDLALRLRKFRDELEAAAKADPGPLTDADLDLLEQAGVDRDQFTPSDIAGIVVMLRFGATLRDEDLPGAVAFGASKDGRAVAFSLQVLLVLRGRMDGAARLTTVAVLDIPRDNRAYGTWKRWECFFGRRDDFPKLSYDFTLALLRRFEEGDEKEQQVVQDLLGKPDLTREQIPALRKAAEARYQEMARLLQQASPPAAREKVWIEDRRGLREVPATSLRRVDRFELRLQAGTDEPWGTLLRHDTADPEDVMAKLAALRQLAASARDDGKDFGEGRGPIAVVLRDEQPWALHSRIDTLDKTVTLALATAELLRVRLTCELPPDAARDERTATTAKALLGAVRGGALRLREVTNAAAQKATPDEAADEPVLRTLRTATADAMAWFLELAAAVPSPAADAGWRDMSIKSDDKLDRTRVRIEADAVHVVTVSSSQRPSDIPGTTHSVRWCTLRREDLRDARFEPSEKNLDLMVTTSRPVLITFADSYPNSSCVSAGYVSVWIPCDSFAHRDELTGALRKFAAGEAR